MNRFENRDWYKVDGASQIELDRLRESIGSTIPDELIELLRFSNGGEGALPFQPFSFVLDSVADLLSSHNSVFERSEFPNFIFIGGNGGGERIAINRGDNSVVCVDPIAGVGSCIRLSNSISEFFAAGHLHRKFCAPPAGRLRAAG